MQAHGIANVLRPGLQALGANSKRVVIAAPNTALWSVDLDGARRIRYPNDPRWDYGVEWRRGQAQGIAWVEVHPATSSEVTTVLNKLKWLKARLNDHAVACSGLPATYHWVATDAGVHIDTARRRRLNAAGLQMPRSRLRI
jgi:hypothetical protein